jgi:putative endonuclease
MTHRYFVYILTNDRRTTLYTGVTNDLARRIHQHKQKVIPGFASRYNLDRLVFYEETNDVVAAIAREKQIKAGSRRKKIDLVNSMNPEWRDLYNDII